MVCMVMVIFSIFVILGNIIREVMSKGDLAIVEKVHLPATDILLNYRHGVDLNKFNGTNCMFRESTIPKLRQTEELNSVSLEI